MIEVTDSAARVIARQMTKQGLADGGRPGSSPQAHRFEVQI
mgnify:CR=1 FL=1